MLGVVLDKRLKAVCVSCVSLKKTIIGTLRLNFKKRNKKQETRGKTCISTAELEADPTEVLLPSLLSKAQVTLEEGMDHLEAISWDRLV